MTEAYDITHDTPKDALALINAALEKLDHLPGRNHSFRVNHIVLSNAGDFGWCVVAHGSYIAEGFTTEAEALRFLAMFILKLSVFVETSQ